jgi:Tfp pilus assembly protein PilF
MIDDGDAHGTTARGLLVARRMLETGNAESALRSVRDVLANDAVNTDALALLARCHGALRQWDEAAEALAALAAVDPDDLRAPALRLVFADRGGAIGKKSLAAAEELLRHDPENALAWHYKAVAHENGGRYEDAETCHRRAVELDPEDADYLASFADFLSKTGRKAEAGTLLAAAAEIAPDSTSVLIATGTRDLREGRVEEAYDKAIWALRQDPNDPAAIALLVSIKTRKNPVMGVWWRWAGLMESVGSGTRWGIVIGLYIAWLVLSKQVLTRLPDMVHTVVVVAWVSFCVLTWVGPWIFRRAIARELRAVKIGRF